MSPDRLISLMYRLEVVLNGAQWDIWFEPHRLGSGSLVRWVRVMNGIRSTRFTWLSYRHDREGD